MKKFLVALLLILMLFTVCACTYVPSTSFLSRSRQNALVETYGTPQAVVTLSYSRTGGSDREVRLTYDLLLSQTPIAVIRFIQLASEGVYNDTLIDTYNTSYQYMVMGRYAAIKETEGSSTYTYYNRTSDVTFAGEFKTNGYKEPEGGYAQFSTLSLAMYHNDTKDSSSFDAANGTLILALDKISLNANNYAVFATMNTFEYRYGNTGEFTKRSKVDDAILADLKSFTSTTSRDVYEDYDVYDDDSKGSSTSIRMLSSRVFIRVEIVGAVGKSSDWSKLPKIGK
ncbi:MAG: hypothetical protein J1F65_01225 [Clostridiales bacterium]|nr:hypothetical protein [Clostridiales bacterium]